MEIDKHSPEISFNAPTIIYENNELPLGVRDCIYFEEASILFLVCCDMNITNRVDAYITNVNLPWEKKTNEYISVGAVFAFKVIGDKKGNSYYFEKLWAKSFQEQIGVVNFNKNSLILQVGLDSGTIILYQTSVESKYLAYDEISIFKPHINRVMGLIYDEQHGYIYSCSTDRKFMLSEYNDITNISQIVESAYGYTNLIYDKPNERIFLTNEGRILSVFSTNVYPPNLVTVIQTHTLNNIRALDIDYHKQYIITGTNKCDISILDLGMPGKEKLIKEISFFGGNLEIKILRYNPEKHELYSGDLRRLGIN